MGSEVLAAIPPSVRMLNRGQRITGRFTKVCTANIRIVNRTPMRRTAAEAPKRRRVEANYALMLPHIA